jgi:hypothetical protein
MSPLDEQVEVLAAMLRAAGGLVGLDPEAPEHVKRAFLQRVLECRDGRQAIMGKHDGRAN